MKNLETSETQFDLRMNGKSTIESSYNNVQEPPLPSPTLNIDHGKQPYNQSLSPISPQGPTRSGGHQVMHTRTYFIAYYCAYIYSLKELLLPADLVLKEEEKQKLVAACDAHNKLLHNFKAVERRHVDMIQAAMAIERHLQSIDQQLVEARSRVSNVVQLARNRSRATNCIFFSSFTQTEQRLTTP